MCTRAPLCVRARVIVSTYTWSTYYKTHIHTHISAQAQVCVRESVYIWSLNQYINERALRCLHTIAPLNALELKCASWCTFVRSIVRDHRLLIGQVAERTQVCEEVDSREYAWVFVSDCGAPLKSPQKETRRAGSVTEKTELNGVFSIVLKRCAGVLDVGKWLDIIGEHGGVNARMRLRNNDTWNSDDCTTSGGQYQLSSDKVFSFFRRHHRDVDALKLHGNFEGIVPRLRREIGVLSSW